LIGFFGNEAVAVFRIRVGREIGSAALVADGQHARVDGFTSLAVLVGVVGVALGAPILDPLAGLGITVAILFIVKSSARAVWMRLIDRIGGGSRRRAAKIPFGSPTDAIGFSARTRRRVGAIGGSCRSAPVITRISADLLRAQVLSKDFEGDKNRRVAILSLARQFRHSGSGSVRGSHQNPIRCSSSLRHGPAEPIA